MLINPNFPNSIRFPVKRKHKERKGPLLKKDFTCWYPHRSLTVDLKGNCYICTCEAWLPYPVGNILEFDTLEEVWTSDIAIKLQNNTKKGTTFKFCDTSICSPMKSNEISPGAPRPSFSRGEHLQYQILVSTDNSCNLQCPSCRTDLIHFNKGPIYEQRKLYTDKIMSLMKDFDAPVSCTLGGSGEIFSSKILSDVLYNYEPHEKHWFKIKTNGTLVGNRIKDSSIMTKLSEFVISIDAGSKAVYEHVRPPGNWEKLITNLDFLKENNFKMYFNFVLQRDNLYDVINFVDLCKYYNAIGYIEGIIDWGTWKIYTDGRRYHYGQHRDEEPINTFYQHRVHQPGDKFYSEWLNIKEQIKQHEWSKVIMGSNINVR